MSDKYSEAKMEEGSILEEVSMEEVRILQL